ncbi:C4-dicarboxylate ABC transporter permease [Lysinibacillus sp. 2017]|uniref:TRAP transporter large permease n=1 Tax=unclassified Lysinibacillus TaxID=2636778 RepID=UPI000D527B99|nr:MULTISPECIES: TRAP transporter large permease [unclassified Lysinibacillus]AWE06164.1 C4-dicarboxylate ABC transporter permease [Lysinibacillus sp. 2017]TGN35181.1 TRAP transporter large permease [Lysinibacillus sp. S2017]
MTWALVAFCILLVIKTPIALILGIISLVYILSTGQTFLLNNISQQLFSGVQSFSLLAIPLFMLAGELMNASGITVRLIDFAKKAVGHFKGGLAYVNVIANMFLASIIGSATAQTAMMSKIMVPEMEKAGYKREFAAATTASAALLGPIIPPSMLFIIYAVGANVSVNDMFMAGIFPGILLALSFVILIMILGIKNDYPSSQKAAFEEVLQSFIRIIPALLVPASIIVGTLSGVFTATESAGVACVIAIIVGKFFYRELSFKKFPGLLINATIATAVVTLLMSTASMFGWILAFERIPQSIVEVMGNISSNPLVFLLLVNLFLLITGVFLDELAVMIILLPIFMPLVHSFGIDPVHFGVMLCLNATIGLLTPPVGAGLFIASSVGEVKMEKLIRQIVPFVFVSIIVLFLVTYIPFLTTWLPSVVNK